MAPQLRPYDQLEHAAKTPMAAAALLGLRQKGASVAHLSGFCKAAVAEGSTKFQTSALANATTERRWHGRLKRDLPAVTLQKLTLKMREKVVKSTVGQGFCKVCVRV